MMDSYRGDFRDQAPDDLTQKVNAQTLVGIGATRQEWICMENAAVAAYYRQGDIAERYRKYAGYDHNSLV